MEGQPDAKAPGRTTARCSLLQSGLFRWLIRGFHYLYAQSSLPVRRRHGLQDVAFPGVSVEVLLQSSLSKTHCDAHRLHEYSSVEVEDGAGCMVVNATADGAEVLARAWCCEKGKSAVVNGQSAACFACAVRCVQMLFLDVLIWTS